MILEVLVSTISRDPRKLCNNISAHDGVEGVVVVRQGGTLSEERLKYGEGCVIVEQTGKGLARSRNRALQAASGDVCVVSDDDVSYRKQSFGLVRKAFQAWPNVDVLTFMTSTKDGQLWKRYPRHVKRHNKRSILRCCSIEIAFRLESVKRAGVQFDERFGLGAKYCTGEDVIFLGDCIDAGLIVGFYPGILGLHPLESSGRTYTAPTVVGKGALFAKIFGLGAFGILPLFMMKHRNKIRQNITLFEFGKAYCSGVVSFLKTSYDRS